MGRAGAPGRRLPALLTLCALVLVSCGGDSDPAEQPEASALGEVRVGSVAQLAQCRDWSSGTREEQLATIGDIRAQINLQDSNVKTPELSDEVAYEVLDNTCSNDFADGFRLYKIYARATGFASFAE